MAHVSLAPRSSRVPRPLATLTALALAVVVAPRASVAQDAVLDWTTITDATVRATGNNQIVGTRIVGIESAAVYDAVNGIERRYSPLHVVPGSHARGSAAAAAVEAAYTILVHQFPSEAGTLATKRQQSLASLRDSRRALAAGVNWGHEVAEAIWAWRGQDGFAPPPPPFLGAAVVGAWRPTPPLLLPGAVPQLATVEPYVLRRPSQFRVPPPPALTSAEYTADFNEAKTWGAATGSPRSADQSELALFWNGNTALFWNRIAVSVAATRSLSLVDTARLFAQMNAAINDGAAACWDAKFRYVTWRPITAIAGGDDDGNPDTSADPGWLPWLPNTPPHPEYPSGHSTLSGAAAYVLAAAFGDATPFTIDSDVRPGTRSFASFSAALAEIHDARVFGGIHFRTACLRGSAMGQAVARYVLTHAMQRARD
jgi:hypothetical protein